MIQVVRQFQWTKADNREYARRARIAMKDIVGTWKLASYEVRLENGQVVKPWGDEFVGYLLNTNEGYTTASMIRTNVDDKTAKESFFSLTGQVERDDNKLKIQIKMCSTLDWVGSIQERVIEASGERLSLISPSYEWEGTTGSFIMTWQRLNR